MPSLYFQFFLASIRLMVANKINRYHGYNHYVKTETVISNHTLYIKFCIIETVKVKYKNTEVKKRLTGLP